MTFPRAFTYPAALFIADIFYIFHRKNRETLKENLRHAFPEKGDNFISSCARRTFRNFGKYLVDFFRFDKFDRNVIEKEIEITGIENIDNNLKQGNGLITVTAHLGNWELGGVIMALLGYKFNVVALSHGSTKVERLFVKQRENKGIRVIPLGRNATRSRALSSSRAASHCIRALKQNEIVALLGDRDISERGIKVRFFDETAILPRGPAFLSMHTDAPVVPGFLIRKENDRFQLILEKAVHEIQTEDKEMKAKRLTEEIAKVIETYIRRYPGQWYMFYPVWRQ
jgi:KDO2-lipid IV(A) lauroyltransferase